jgi:hypothetical protein
VGSGPSSGSPGEVYGALEVAAVCACVCVRVYARGGVQERVAQRAAAKLKEAALPPRMEMWEITKKLKKSTSESKEDFTAAFSFRPAINPTVPDFEKAKQTWEATLKVRCLPAGTTATHGPARAWVQPWRHPPAPSSCAGANHLRPAAGQWLWRAGRMQWPAIDARTLQT